MIIINHFEKLDIILFIKSLKIKYNIIYLNKDNSITFRKK